MRSFVPKIEQSDVEELSKHIMAKANKNYVEGQIDVDILAQAIMDTSIAIGGGI